MQLTLQILANLGINIFMIKLNYIKNSCFRLVSSSFSEQEQASDSYIFNFGSFNIFKQVTSEKKVVTFYKNIIFYKSSENQIRMGKSFFSRSNLPNSKEKEKFEYLYKQNRDNRNT